MGKLRINKIPGQKPDVNFTLADSICAPVAGLSEFDKNALVSCNVIKLLDFAKLDQLTL